MNQTIEQMLDELVTEMAGAGFGDDVAGADGECLQRDLAAFATGAGEEDDLGSALRCEQMRQHLQPVEAGHLHVEQDQIDRLGADEFDGLIPAGDRAGDGKPLICRQHFGHDASHDDRVVDDQHVDGASGRSEAFRGVDGSAGHER